LTQDLCRVCALPSGHVSEALDYLGCRADVLSLDPYSLDEVLGTILTVGERTGTAERAARVVAGLRARLDAVAARVAGRPRPRVAVVEWVDPPFAAGHWIPDLVTAAGGEPVAARGGQRSSPLSWQAVAAASPDLVIVAPCGYHLAGVPGGGRDGRAARRSGVGDRRGLPRGAPGTAARGRGGGDRGDPASRGGARAADEERRASAFRKLADGRPDRP
jgi:iron complex transport system substrate-binding protein